MKKQNNFNYEKEKLSIKRAAAFETLVYVLGFLIIGTLIAWTVSQIL